MWVSCVAYLSYGIVPIDCSPFLLVSYLWHWMNLEAVSLIHNVNECVDFVAH
jgi:hypothetical protein